jgi:GGDEF domain-containing protein
MKNLTDLMTRLQDEHNDFISRDGVISKTAFYQIFMSCIDRADRYGEETFLLFVRIDNIHDITQFYGDQTAEDICEKVKKYTVKIRRLSDIIGRTAPNELCLMISRPMNRNEPVMAVNRFTDSIMEYADLFISGDARGKISVHMMAIPSGRILFSKECY